MSLRTTAEYQADCAKTAFFIGLVLGSSASLFLVVLLWLDYTKHWHAEAVKRGFAEYTVDALGDTTWKWKESK